MDRIKLSDESALKTLYDRLWEPMFTIAFAILQDKETAKDTLQEVWINIWQRRNAIENSNIEGYIVQAVRLTSFKKLRDSKSSVGISEFLETLKSSDNDTILESLYVKDTKIQIDNSIGRLPEKCRQVFVLSRYAGLNNSEISKKLGISKRTVETHVSNAIRRVKSDLIIPTTILFSTFF